MVNSLISIVIPIYNAEQYLNRCIKSVVSQTYSNIEIILVNDGSTDSSLRICYEYSKSDRRIEIIDKSNGGVSSARNEGILCSKGEYIMVLDSDDWWAPDMCQVMYDTIERENVDCVVCGAHQTNGNIWAPESYKIYRTLDDFKDDFVYWLNTELLSPSWNKIYKRTKIRKFYPEDMSFGEDLVFNLNYLKECNAIAFIPDRLYQHEVLNINSITHTFDSRRFINIEKIQDEILGVLHDKTDKRLYTKYINEVIFLVRHFFLQEDYSFIEKKYILKEWLIHSYLRHLDILNNKIGLTDKLILCCLKIGFFRFLNWIVKLGQFTNSIYKK